MCRSGIRRTIYEPQAKVALQDDVKGEASYPRSESRMGRRDEPRRRPRWGERRYNRVFLEPKARARPATIVESRRYEARPEKIQY